MTHKVSGFECVTRAYSSDILITVQTTSGKTFKEKDEGIYTTTCRLCSLHQQSGFVAALKLAHRLSQELNT